MHSTAQKDKKVLKFILDIIGKSMGSDANIYAKSSIYARARNNENYTNLISMGEVA